MQVSKPQYKAHKQVPDIKKDRFIEFPVFPFLLDPEIKIPV